MAIQNSTCSVVKDVTEFYAKIDEENKSTVAEGKETQDALENAPIGITLIYGTGAGNSNGNNAGNIGHNNMRRSDVCRRKRGLVKVPALPLATQLVYHTAHGENANLSSDNRTVISLALLQAVLPSMVIFIEDSRTARERSQLEIVETLFGFVLTFLFFNTALMFIDVGRIDYQRRANIIRAVGSLIKFDSLIAQQCGMDIFIDLAWPVNVSAWLEFRRLLITMGSQFRPRIALYTSYITVFLIGLMLWVLISIFAIGEVTTLAVATVGGFLLSLGYFLGRSIWYGSATNEQFGYQARSLSRIQLRLRELRTSVIMKHAATHRISLKEKMIEARLMQADSLMDAATHLLDMDSKLEPITILGIPASKELYTTTATLVLSAIGGILVEYYFNSQ
eukprot:CAMPEP_0114497352 /NCGR_PEP_ID=MMETSP0109-20121206/6280_1 /TAXON_ID=29199 /ORGANISM="Chlorarachnion reptans, Strain CCCM449" /LENGTH=392 /DNA_ID=CAMNT_0001674731 /DNA_START=902 /DNA_END=2080 /DNA_ORIENTATION=-